MFRELIADAIAKNNNKACLQEPCSEGEIARAEKYVGFDFPEDLITLLRETNGDHWLLLSADGIIDNVKRNREILAEYLEPDEFEEMVNRNIYFATNGCGDYYCYRVLDDGTVDTSAIYIWEHELFEIRKVATNLTEFIKKYYNDEI